MHCCILKINHVEGSRKSKLITRKLTAPEQTNTGEKRALRFREISKIFHKYEYQGTKITVSFIQGRIFDLKVFNSLQIDVFVDRGKPFIWRELVTIPFAIGKVSLYSGNYSVQIEIKIEF